MKAIAIAIPIAIALVSGCFGKGDEVLQAADDQSRVDDLLGVAGRDKLVDAAAIIPKNYSFPEQRLLPPVRLEFKVPVGADVNGGYEAERDEGGIDYNSKIVWQDVANILPPGQPAELVIKLVWDASEINSADLDIAVDVPGTRTTYSPTSETFNWNLAVKQLVVDTVGVQGLPARVGVQVASASVTRGFEYTLTVDVTYVKDVLTPYHAWELNVPPDAGGLILESEKAGGDEHITSEFIVIGPEDDLVAYVDFNDLNIPTQSVFVPTAKSGRYVFYANSMHGGFLRVKADVPLETLNARPLTLVERSVVDASTPSPGVAGKDVFNGSAAQGVVPRDDVAATKIAFSPEGPFPLRVEAFIRGAVTTMAKITLKSPLGTVDQKTVIARVQDERGTVGYTSEHRGGADHLLTWRNIQKGAWTAEVVLDSPNVEVGHTVLTYER